MEETNCFMLFNFMKNAMAALQNDELCAFLFFLKRVGIFLFPSTVALHRPTKAGATFPTKEIYIPSLAAGKPCNELLILS